MGVHPVIINGFCRALGYKRADYRPLLAAVGRRHGTEEDTDGRNRDGLLGLARPDDDRRPGVGATAAGGQLLLGAARRSATRRKETGVQAVVMMTGEHFTNFFLDDLPQIAIGLDDEHLGPPEVWLQVPKKMVPSRRRAGRAHHREPDRAGPAARAVVRHEGRPRVHDRLLLARPDHGTPDGADRAQLHDAAADDRAAVLGLRRRARQRDPLLRRSGAGRPGAPAAGCRTSSASRGSATSTRSSTAGSSTSSGSGDLSEILDMPNDVLMEAGNGTGEVRAWVALAGAMGSAAGPRARLRGRSTSGSTGWASCCTRGPARGLQT